MKAMPPSLSGVYHAVGLVEGPQKASPGVSCAQAPWSHHPDFDQANCYKAPFLPEFASLGWNTTMLLPRDDAKGLRGASRRITRTPAEYIAFKNGRITPPIEEHPSRMLPSSSDSSDTSGPAAMASAARGRTAAARIEEKLLNTNITPDTTLYDHYQPYQQQHSEEVALEQRGRSTVSSTSSSTSLLLEKNREQEEPAYYDSSRYSGCFTPLPMDFPPPSPEEWEEIMMVVRELV